jgi:hypothetical protein
MKNTIWTFGDSFTEGYNGDWGNEYIKWKGYKPKNYTEILAEKFDMDLINLGKGGSDNYTIFENFCKNVNNFKNDDIVVINWSSVLRFRLVDNRNNWKVFMPESLQNNIINYSVSYDTISEILTNRDSHLYIEELNSKILLLNSIKKDYKLFQWTYANDGKLNTTYIGHCEKIFNETNGELSDGHYSEKGNLELADYLINVIDGKTKII